MDFTSLIMMIVAVVVVVAILQHNIQKITKAIDIQDANNEPQSAPKHGFERFCDFINDELNAVKMLKIKQELNQADILEKIDELSREIKFIKRMNQNSDESIWNQKLGEFLHKLDDFIIASFENGQDLADELRMKFQKEFSNI